MEKTIEIELYDTDKEMLDKWVHTEFEKEYFFRLLTTNRMLIYNVLYLGDEYGPKKFMHTIGYNFYNFAHRLIFTVMIDQYEEFFKTGKLVIKGRKPRDGENDLIQYWFGKLFL